MSERAGRVADATGNWVDSLAPASTRPYLRLARLDRPIGSWLLLMPCWWSVGARRHARRRSFPSLWHIVLFFIGAFAMRGAGCTWNDLVDRELDARGRAHALAADPVRAGDASRRRPPSWWLQALVGLAGAAAVQPLYDLCGFASLVRRRDLSVHEAHHLLAADRARPRVLLGRADGLARRVRRGSIGRR